MSVAISGYSGLAHFRHQKPRTITINSFALHSHNRFQFYFKIAKDFLFFVVVEFLLNSHFSIVSFFNWFRNYPSGNLIFSIITVTLTTSDFALCVLITTNGEVLSRKFDVTFFFDRTGGNNYSSRGCEKWRRLNVWWEILNICWTLKNG